MTVRKLTEIVQIAGDTVNPQRFPDEPFHLFSIPAYDASCPEISVGAQIRSNKTEVNAGDVLFSKLNPRIPRAWLVPEVTECRQICSTEFVPLRLKNAGILEPEYLRWLLLSPQFLEPIQSAVRSSTKSHQRIRPELLLDQAIPVPPIDDQRRIVVRIKELMQRIDETSSLRLAALTELRSLEPAVFADFIEANRSEPLPGIQLGKIVTSVQYGTSQKASPNGSGVPILRMGNIQNGALSTSDLKFIELSGRELAKYRLEEGDILFNRTNSLELVGKAATFQGHLGDWVFASYLVRLVIDRTKAVPEYVTAVINSRIGRAFVCQNASRAIGMVNINARKIQRLTIPLPSLKTQQELVEQLQTARKVTAELETTMDAKAIESLPQSILRKAFAGEL